MTQQDPPSRSDGDSPQGDPWQAFGYLVSGVAIYGFLGWLVDRWLGTSFIVAIGIVLGAGFGIYLTLVRFHRPPETKQEKN
jgi:ATP synthase protein I